MPENPPRKHRHIRKRVHFRGCDTERQKRAIEIKRNAVVQICAALEEYFTAELDAELEQLEEFAKLEAEPNIDAEFQTEVTEQ